MSTSTSSSSSSSSSSAKKLCGVSKNWRRLRKDILRYVLYSTMPTGEGQHILSLVKIYCFEYEKLPISRLLSIIRPMADGKNSFREKEILNYEYSEPIHPNIARLYYKKSNDRLRILKPNETGAIPRKNKWRFKVMIMKFHTQPHWTKGREIKILIQKSYQRMAWGDTVSSRGLDCYECEPTVRVTYTREGILKDLIEDPKFVYHMRDLIFKGIHKVQEAKLCIKTKAKYVTMSDHTSHYSVMCGSRVRGESNICDHCWKRSFGRFVAGLAGGK